MIQGQNRKIYSLEEALEKMKRYCAYQERCHQEVEQKLISYGLGEEARAHVVLTLIEENCLSEERFAQAYVSGKFRVKKWGKRKIKLHLQQKGVSAYCIKKGMEEISQEEYEEGARALFERKRDLNGAGSSFKALQKVKQYMIQKGFEPDLVYQLVQEHTV